jgi:tetratricopeptide (TPR) repeat protein
LLRLVSVTGVALRACLGRTTLDSNSSLHYFQLLTLELNPDVFPGNISLSRTYIVQGRAQDALSEIELIRYDPERASMHAIAYYALGRKNEADAALSELIAKYHASTAYQISEVYAFRNQSDEAFEWLDRAYVQRDDDLIVTKVDPLLKNLYRDPRYSALLKKLSMPN